MKIRLLITLAIFVFISACKDNPSGFDPDQLENLEVIALANKTQFFPDYDKDIRATLFNASPFPVYLNKSGFIKIQQLIDDEWTDGTPTGVKGLWYDANETDSFYKLSVEEKQQLELLSIEKVMANKPGTYRFVLDYCLVPYSEAGTCSEKPPVEETINYQFKIASARDDYSNVDSRLRILDLDITTADSVYDVSEKIVPLRIRNNSTFPVYLNEHLPLSYFESYKNDHWIFGLNDDEASAGWSYRIETKDYYVLEQGEEIIVRPLNIDSHLNNRPGKYRFNFKLCLDEWDDLLCEAYVPDQFSAVATFEIKSE